MRILILSLFTVFTFNGFAQISFYKLYSGNGYDRGEGVVQLADSSYTITGSSSSWTGNSDVFLLHLDSLGNYKWSRNYGGNESDIGRRVLYNSTLGYFIAGYSNSFSGNGNFDAFLIKTDINGNEQWIKNYNKTDHWEKINDAVLTIDTGVVMVGEMISTTDGKSDVYIIRTDKNGDTLWTKKMGTEEDDVAHTILNIGNDEYIIGGEWYNSDSSQTKAFLMKINQNGDSLWHNFYGNYSGQYGFRDIAIGANLMYAVGYRKVTETNFDHYITRIDSNGNILYQFTMLDGNNPKSEILDEVLFLPNSNKVALGFRIISSETFQDNFDILTGYIDAPSFYWLNQSITINNEGLDEIGQLISSSDGEYIMVGTNTSMGETNFTENGGSNIYVMKVGSNGTFPVTFGVYNLDQLVQISQNFDYQKIMLFPNPVEDCLFIKSENDFNYTLVNSNGKIIKSGKYCIQNKFISFSELDRGMYFLEINNSNNCFKIIKN
jgi:hypothetical protein